MTILLCTTESFLLTSLEYRFRKHGWKLEVVHTTEEALEATKNLQPDLIVVDLQLPDYQGRDIVQDVAKHVSPDIPILVGAPLKEGDLMMEAIRLGAKDFIVAPYKPDELTMRIRRLLHLQKVAG
ncbi:MAG TPA: response regulator transcription factor [Bacteroidetes bacterium]|nr:response regulator transcription factor [Bacteroidota bacterium]